MEEIQRGQQDDPQPTECPPNRQYIPQALRHRTLQWVHTSLSSGHPGIHRTMTLVRNTFWWPHMNWDIINYLKACSVCAQSKTPRELPAGLLQPLPIPHRLWSHLSIDFVTNLPNSNGYTTVDHFSKSCRLIPLKGLPNAMETLKLFQHIQSLWDTRGHSSCVPFGRAHPYALIPSKGLPSRVRALIG